MISLKSALFSKGFSDKTFKELGMSGIAINNPIRDMKRIYRLAWMLVGMLMCWPADRHVQPYEQR